MAKPAKQKSRVDGADSLVSKLRGLAKAQHSVECRVGYSAAYALAVHENMTAVHRVGQAKFLEQPAREMRKDLGAGVREDMKKGRPLGAALYRAGLTLQRASQLLCPVDTGNLKGSAQTTLEETS